MTTSMYERLGGTRRLKSRSRFSKTRVLADAVLDGPHAFTGVDPAAATRLMDAAESFRPAIVTAG